MTEGAMKLAERFEQWCKEHEVVVHCESDLARAVRDFKHVVVAEATPHVEALHALGFKKVVIATERWCSRGYNSLSENAPECALVNFPDGSQVGGKLENARLMDSPVRNLKLYWSGQGPTARKCTIPTA